ncbi:MAG: hypothetical protein AB8H86_27570 [Polyangiales bacterium]
MLRNVIIILVLGCGASYSPPATAPVSIPEPDVEAARVPPAEALPSRSQLRAATVELKTMFTMAVVLFSTPDSAGKPQRCALASARVERGEAIPASFEALMITEMPTVAAAMEIESPLSENCDIPVPAPLVYVFRIEIDAETPTHPTLSLRIASDAEGWLYRGAEFEYTDDLGRQFLVDDEGQQVPSQASQP